MNIQILAHKFPWFSSHTGYDLLSLYIKNINPEACIIASRFGLLQRCIGKAYSLSHGWWYRRDSIFAEAEWRFSNAIQKNTCDISHVLYFECFYHFFDKWPKAPLNIIGTIHHPPEQQKNRVIESMKRLSSAIILYQKDIQFFEKYVGKNRVKFIYHGVDTDFFHPARKQWSEPKRILFIGQNGRNTLMLKRLIEKLADRHPELQFDLLVRKEIRSFEGLRELLGHPNVNWHEGLSDDKLLEFYQSSYILLLPMNAIAACNVVVEAMACGVPVVTTDVGGIRDYGGDAIYPVVKNNDDDAMIDIIEHYLSNSDWRSEISKRCRDFAEKNLTWPLIAQRHLEVYKELIK